jgi:hypothetical protein
MVATVITAETLQPYHKANPHVEAPGVMAPLTPGPRPLPTGAVINQIR